MGKATRLMTLAAAVATAAPLLVAGAAGTAAADGPVGANRGSTTVLPFNQILRRCDFSDTEYTAPTGYARVDGVLYRAGSGLSADIQMFAAVPNTRYDVLLIQVPRPSSEGCLGGDPGVAAGVLATNDVGAANVTLQDTIEPGAQGVWVTITRPAPFSQIPDEFYSTTFVADF